MKQEEVNSEQYNKILEGIMPALINNGLKATTMDSISSSLKMSKRTLYEIFGSKEEMFKEVHKFFHKKISEKLKNLFESSGNIMEGIIKCFIYNRDIMSKVSPDFLRDMEKISNQSALISEVDRQHHYQHFYDVLELGVKEGYFRNDVNLKVQCRMLTIQMEALKRTEELFPQDISLLDVYDSIITGFLRGISSQKGLVEIDKYMPSLSSNIL